MSQSQSEDSAKRIMDALNAPPPSWWAYLQGPWPRRRVKSVLLGVLAATPGLRAHVLSTTAIKDHPMYATMERATWRVWEARGLVITDHPDGCFYGSFVNAYPDKWHIPHGVDCPLPHGVDPIRLEAPSA